MVSERFEAPSSKVEQVSSPGVHAAAAEAYSSRVPEAHSTSDTSKSALPAAAIDSTGISFGSHPESMSRTQMAQVQDAPRTTSSITTDSNGARHTTSQRDGKTIGEETINPDGSGDSKSYGSNGMHENRWTNKSGDTGVSSDYDKNNQLVRQERYSPDGRTVTQFNGDFRGTQAFDKDGRKIGGETVYKDGHGTASSYAPDGSYSRNKFDGQGNGVFQNFNANEDLIRQEQYGPKRSIKTEDFKPEAPHEVPPAPKPHYKLPHDVG